MRLFSVATAAMAMLSGVASAASAAGAGAAGGAASASPLSDPAVVQAVMQAQKLFPPCALGCLTDLLLVPDPPCALTDTQCLCTNKPMNAQLGACVLQSCTKYEALMAKNGSMTMCHQPVRDDHKTPMLIGVIGGAIALFVVILRLFSGLPKGGRALGWDDYTIILAMALSIPPSVFSILLSNNGLGRDMWTLPLENIKNVLFYYYLGELFYFGGLSVTKISILIFILRVFPDATFRKIVYGVCGLCAAYGITFITITAVQCQPISYSWEQIDSNAVGKCNNIHLQGWMSAIFNIIIDLIILVLPLKNLYELQLNWKKKIMLMVMFSLGIFVTIVSIIRLKSLIVFAASENITWDYNEAAWWSTVELDVGIICACLPALRALFISMGVKVLGSSKGDSRATGYSSKNSTGKGLSTSEKHGQSVPRHGDESDFIPLVEVNDGRGASRAGSRADGRGTPADPYAHFDEDIGTQKDRLS